MCQQGGSWFQAAVLTLETNATTRARAQVKVFDKMDKYKNFLSKTLGTLLSPQLNTNTPTPTLTTTNKGGAVAHSYICLTVHGVFLSLCLRILS